MRKALGITLVLVVALSVSAFARPADNNLMKTKLMDDNEVLDSTNHLGVFGTAQAGTTWFGGTVWAADSNRWEAIQGGVWTFNSGVGSHYDFTAEGVNPFKYGAAGEPDPLHAYMEGWVGFDYTFSDLPYFRILSVDEFMSPDTCVGTPAGLGGDYSFYAGVMEHEANELCWVAGQGVGNSWYLCVGQTFDFAGGGLTWEFDYVNETEECCDYTWVISDTLGGNGMTSDGDLLVAEYRGADSGHELLNLTEGVDLPEVDTGTVPVTLKFCVVTDGGWSDEDGLEPTDCGAFAFDDVSVTGVGISHSADFEGGVANGWHLLDLAPGVGGEWSNIVAFADMPPVQTPCDCPLEDSVLVFTDLDVGGHAALQSNIAVSPWIDLKAAGFVGSPGKLVRFSGYFELPRINGIFWQHGVQFYPYVCPFTNKVVMSGYVGDGFVYYFGGIPTCRSETDGRQVDQDYSEFIDVGAEQLRVSMGVVNYCRYIYGCTGTTNGTPYLDDIKFGVYGDPAAPYISVRTLDVPQDVFPESGNLRLDAPGRMDSNNLTTGSPPTPSSQNGDTLIVAGASGGAEVWVQFMVDPGPGIDGSALSAWLTSHPFRETKDGFDWYWARMDTAEVGGNPDQGFWMTTYHELDPSGNFTGNDEDLDANDPNPMGGLTRLANEIFPDDLFTAGTRINLFYVTKFETGTQWFARPDTSVFAPYEMEIMPSSMDADSTFNCVLYVDHADDRPSQAVIEPALAAVMTTGSANYENTAWDRYDVRTPSTGLGGLGRPLGTEYGGTVQQILGYKEIIWDTRYLSASDMDQTDANVLIPWLSIIDPAVPEFGGNNFWGSGDGLAKAIQQDQAEHPAALRFMNEFCGVDWVCERVGEANCPIGTPAYPDTCIDLYPVTGARVADQLAGGRAYDHVGYSNGCPTQRSYDVLAPFVGGIGLPLGDEEYYSLSAMQGTAGLTPAGYSSITNESLGGVDPEYKTVWDGVSLASRRVLNDCGWFGDRNPVTERVLEVQTWFGYTDGQGYTGGDCSDISGGTDVPGPRIGTTFKTALANFAPNPLVGGAKGTIQFTMARDAKATVEIFDVTGRLVQTVFSGVAEEGLNVVHWNGRDTSERTVASGVYFYRLTADGNEFAKKLVVVQNGN